jgi:hypothetical protein
MLPESAPADGLTIRRALWAIDVGDVPFVDVQVPHDVATGDPAPRAAQT